MSAKYTLFEQNESKSRMQERIGSMTQVEKTVAKFFINNKEIMDFSSKSIAGMLYVSDATLSRFAKKCGYKGYREFIFSYEKDLQNELNHVVSEKDINIFTRKVKESYHSLLLENFRLLDEAQIKRIAAMLNSSKRVFIYGMGSSGYVAEEFQLRFMRTGLDVTAETNPQMIKMSAALVSSDSLVIAISLSGNTTEIIDSIKSAHSHGAKVICFTASTDQTLQEMCDEVIQVAYLKNLDTGTKISPQFSLLVMIDILYSYYFANDTYFKTLKYKETLSAINDRRADDVSGDQYEAE